MMVNQSVGFQDLNRLYQDLIMEHYRAPSNFGPLENPDFEAEGYNPLCGDRVKLMVKMVSGKVSACHFTGEGCSICMASASMMTEEFEERTIDEVRTLISTFRNVMKGEAPPSEIEGDLESLIGVKEFPVRIKCVLLPWTTMNEALNKHKES